MSPEEIRLECLRLAVGMHKAPNAFEETPLGTAQKISDFVFRKDGPTRNFLSKKDAQEDRKNRMECLRLAADARQSLCLGLETPFEIASKMCDFIDENPFS